MGAVGSEVGKGVKRDERGEREGSLGECFCCWFLGLFCSRSGYESGLEDGSWRGCRSQNQKPDEGGDEGTEGRMSCTRSLLGTTFRLGSEVGRLKRPSSSLMVVGQRKLVPRRDDTDWLKGRGRVQGGGGG